MISRETLKENQQGDDMLHGVLTSPCIGRLAAPSKAGEILVEVDGCITKVAKLLSGLNRVELSKPESAGREVLLVFEQGDPERPIIIGLIEDPLENLVSLEIPKEDIKRPKDALIDGKRVTIEAEEEVVLKCGDGSITIRKDGKIIIKGTHLLSRSSGPIRVKGANVNIN